MGGGGEARPPTTQHVLKEIADKIRQNGWGTTFFFFFLREITPVDTMSKPHEQKAPQEQQSPVAFPPTWPAQ